MTIAWYVQFKPTPTHKVWKYIQWSEEMEKAYQKYKKGELSSGGFEMSNRGVPNTKIDFVNMKWYSLDTSNHSQNPDDFHAYELKRECLDDN